MRTCRNPKRKIPRKRVLLLFVTTGLAGLAMGWTPRAGFGQGSSSTLSGDPESSLESSNERVLGAEPLTEDQLHELFSQAKQSFRQGLQVLSEGDEDGGEFLIREAAARFQAILEGGDLENGYLYYNLGNCHFWLNDLGRAIVNYRRAERVIPTDGDLRQNLFAARQKCRDRFTKTTESRLLETVFFWHYAFPLRWKLGGTLALFLIAWTLAIVNLFLRKRSCKILALVGFFFVAVLGVSSAIDYRADSTRLEGVVVAEEFVARKGDGESYEPAFEEPLHAGTEWILVEERGAWVEIRLPDGRQCWVKRSAIEFV